MSEILWFTAPINSGANRKLSRASPCQDVGKPFFLHRSRPSYYADWLLFSQTIPMEFSLST